MASPFSSALQDGCKDSAMRYTTTPLQTPHDPHTSTSTAIQVSENSNERTSANNSHQTEHASRSLQRVSASLTSDAGPATGTDSVGATSTGPFPGSGDGYFFDSLAADAFAGATQPSVASSGALYAIASYETTPPRLRPALTPSSSLQPNINIVNNAREHWNVERSSRATHGASQDGTAPATTTIAPLRLQLGTAHTAGNGVGAKAAEAARPRASTGPSSSSATSRGAAPLTTSSAHRPELQGGRLPQSHSTVDVPYSQMLSASLTPSRPLSALDSVTHSRGPYFFGTPQTEPDVNEQSGHSGLAGEETHAPLPATTAARSTAGQQRQSSAGFTHRRHTPMCPDDSSASSSSRLLLLPPPSTLLARGQQLHALNSGSHSSSAVNAMASESGGYCLFGLGTPSVDRPSRAARVQGCKDSVESGSALLSLPAVDSHRTSDGAPDAAHPLTPVASDNTHVPSSGPCATDARDGREALATPLASPVYFGLETVPSTSGLEKGVRASPVLLPSATPAGKLSRQGTTAAVNKEKESDGKEKVAGGAEKAADVSTTSGGQQAAGGPRPLSVANKKKTHDDDIRASATTSPQQGVQQPPTTATALLGVRAAASPHARQPSHRPSLPSLPAQAPRCVSSSSGSLLLSPRNVDTETRSQGAAAARAAAPGLEAARRATVAPLTAFTPPSAASAAPPAAAGMPPLVVAPADRHRYDTPHTISTESSHPAPQQPQQQLEEAYVSYLSISSGSPATGAVVVAPAKAEGKGEATHSTNGRVATSKRVSLSGPTLASPQTHASQQTQQQEEQQQQHQIQSPSAGPPGHHASSRQHLRATRVPPPLSDAAVTRKSCSMSLPSTRSERSGANPALEGSSTGSGSPANATSMQRRTTKRPGDSMNSTSLSSGVGRGVSPPGRRFVLRRAGEKKGLPSRINLAKAAKAAQTAARSRGDGRPPIDAEPPPSPAQAPSASAGSSPAASNPLSASHVSELMSPPPLSGAQTERQRTKDDPQQKPKTAHRPASTVRVAAPSSAAVPPLQLRDGPSFISSATSPRRGVTRVGATRLRLKAKPLVQSQQSALTASTASSVTSAVSVRPPAAVGAAAAGRPSPSVSISSSQPPVLLHAHTGRSLTPNSVSGSTATALTAPTSAAALCGVQQQLATPRPCDAESPPVRAALTVGTSASTTTVTVKRGGADTTLVSLPAAAQPARGGRLRFQPRVSRQVRPAAKEAAHRPPLAHRPKQPGLTPSAQASAIDAQKQEKSKQSATAVLHDSVVSSALVGAATPSPRGPAEQSVLGSQEAVSGHSASQGSSQSCASVRPSRPQREQSAGPTEIVRGMPPRSTPAPAAVAGNVEEEKVNKVVHVDEDAVEPTGDTTQEDQTTPSLVARHAQGSVTAPSVGEEEEGAVPSMPTTPYLITAIRPPRTRAAAGPSKRVSDEAATAAAKDASGQVKAVERLEAANNSGPPHRVLVEAVEDSRKQAATPVQVLMDHDSQPSLALNREETEAFLCAAVPSINEEMERQINRTRTQAASNAAVVEGSAEEASCEPAGPTETALRSDSRPLHNVSNLVEAVPLVAHSQLGKDEAEGRNKSSIADAFPTSASHKHQHPAPVMEALASPTTSSEAVSPSTALSPEPSTAPPEAASRPENVSEIGALPSFVNVSDEATQSSAITGPSAITTDQSPSQATDGTAHSATVTCLTNTKIMRDTTQAPTTVTRTWVAYTAAGGASTPTATACYPRSALYSFFASVCGATQPPGEGEAAAQLQLSVDDGTATCPSKANTTASFHATPVLGSRATTGASLVTIASTARGVGETPRHTFSSKPPSPAPLLCDPSSSALVTASVSTRGGSYGGGSGGGSSGAHTNSGVGSSSPMTRLATLLFTHSHAHAGERASMVDDGSASVRGLSHTGRATTVAAAQLPPAVVVTPPLQDKEEAVTERRMSSTTASVGQKKKDDAEVVSGAAMEGEAEQQALDATLLSPSASPTSAAQQLQQHLAAWQRLSSPFTEPSLANTVPLKTAPPSLVSPHAAATPAAAESERAASLQTCRSLSGRRWTSVLSADRLHEFARIASLPRASRTTDRGLPTHVQVHPGSSFFCSADMPLGRRATRPSDGKPGAEKPLRGEMRFSSVITNNSTPHLINATPAAAAPRDPQPLPVLPNNAMEQLRQEMCAALLNHPGDQGRKAAAAMGPQQVSLLQQVQVQSSTSTSGVYPDADSSSGGRWSPQSSDRGEDAAFPRRASRQPGRPTVADTAAPRDRATVRRTSRRSLMWPSQHQPQQQSSPRASTGAHEDDGTVGANAAAGPGKAPGDGTSTYARPPFSDIMALLHSDDEDGGASGRAERSGQSDVAFIAYDADVEDVMRVKAEVMRRTGRRPSQTSLTQRRPLSAHFTPDSVSSTAGTLSAAKPCLQTTSSFARSVPARSAALVVRHTRHNSDVTLVDPEESLLTMDTPLQPPSTQLSAVTRKPAGGEDSRHEREGRSGVGDAVSPTVQATSPASPGAPVSVESSSYSRHDHDAAAANASRRARRHSPTLSLQSAVMLSTDGGSDSDTSDAVSDSREFAADDTSALSQRSARSRGSVSATTSGGGGLAQQASGNSSSRGLRRHTGGQRRSGVCFRAAPSSEGPTEAQARNGPAEQQGEASSTHHRTAKRLQEMRAAALQQQQATQPWRPRMEPHPQHQQQQPQHSRVQTLPSILLSATEDTFPSVSMPSEEAVAAAAAAPGRAEEKVKRAADNESGTSDYSLGDESGSSGSRMLRSTLARQHRRPSVGAPEDGGVSPVLSALLQLRSRPTPLVVDTLRMPAHAAAAAAAARAGTAAPHHSSSIPIAATAAAAHTPTTTTDTTTATTGNSPYAEVHTAVPTPSSTRGTTASPRRRKDSGEAQRREEPPAARHLASPPALRVKAAGSDPLTPEDATPVAKPGPPKQDAAGTVGGAELDRVASRRGQSPPPAPPPAQQEPHTQQQRSTQHPKKEVEVNVSSAYHPLTLGKLSALGTTPLLNPSAVSRSAITFRSGYGSALVSTADNAFAPAPPLLTGADGDEQQLTVVVERAASLMNPPPLELPPGVMTRVSPTEHTPTTSLADNRAVASRQSSSSNSNHREADDADDGASTGEATTRSSSSSPPPVVITGIRADRNPAEQSLVALVETDEAAPLRLQPLREGISPGLEATTSVFASATASSGTGSANNRALLLAAASLTVNSPGNGAWDAEQHRIPLQSVVTIVSPTAAGTRPDEARLKRTKVDRPTAPTASPSGVISMDNVSSAMISEASTLLPGSLTLFSVSSSALPAPEREGERAPAGAATAASTHAPSSASSAKAADTRVRAYSSSGGSGRSSVTGSDHTAVAREDVEETAAVGQTAATLAAVHGSPSAGQGILVSTTRNWHEVSANTTPTHAPLVTPRLGSSYRISAPALPDECDASASLGARSPFLLDDLTAPASPPSPSSASPPTALLSGEINGRRRANRRRSASLSILPDTQPSGAAAGCGSGGTVVERGPDAAPRSLLPQPPSTAQPSPRPQPLSLTGGAPHPHQRLLGTATVVTPPPALAASSPGPPLLCGLVPSLTSPDSLRPQPPPSLLTQRYRVSFCDEVAGVGSNSSSAMPLMRDGGMPGPQVVGLLSPRTALLMSKSLPQGSALGTGEPMVPHRPAAAGTLNVPCVDDNSGVSISGTAAGTGLPRRSRDVGNGQVSLLADRDGEAGSLGRHRDGGAEEEEENGKAAEAGIKTVTPKRPMWTRSPVTRPEQRETPQVTDYTVATPSTLRHVQPRGSAMEPQLSPAAAILRAHGLQSVGSASTAALDGPQRPLRK